MSKFGEMGMASVSVNAELVRGIPDAERCEAHGVYHVSCVGEDGTEKWSDVFDNVVTTLGKNLALDTFLAGSAYTVAGPYLGLISGASYTATAAGDTMASHSGWLEAGITNAPTYSSGRKTAAWSAAASGSKSLSAALSFVFTGAGTVQGAFLVFGSGALSTVDNTAGVLYSAGAFSGGSKTVASGDTLNVSYAASL